jgi:hypothetical protein
MSIDLRCIGDELPFAEHESTQEREAYVRATPLNSEDGQRALRVEAAIEMKPRTPAFTRSFSLVLAFATLLCGGPISSRAEDDGFAIEAIGPGMNRTELTAVLGPPSYIQVRYRREAWQYCPGRSLTRFLQDVLRQPRDPELYVTVWLNEGRVEHMRAYPSKVMGQCEDFLAAFSWEDVIEGDGFAGGYRIK